jgi:hypothetical protein
MKFVVPAREINFAQTANVLYCQFVYRVNQADKNCISNSTRRRGNTNQPQLKLHACLEKLNN